MSPYAALMLFKNNFKKNEVLNQTPRGGLSLCVGRRLVSKGGKSAANASAENTVIPGGNCACNLAGVWQRLITASCWKSFSQDNNSVSARHKPFNQ